MPCTVSATPISPVPLPGLPSSSPAVAFGTFPQTTGYVPAGPSVAQPVSPLTLWLGRLSARENEVHYKRLIEHLASGVESRLNRDPRARMSGLLIDTVGVTTADGRSKYSLLQHCIQVFKGEPDKTTSCRLVAMLTSISSSVDTVVVLGHEKLTIELGRLFPPASGVSVVKIGKSEGVVEVDEMYRERLRSIQVRNYFYGGSNAKAKPTTNADGELEESKPLPSGEETLGGVPSLNAFSTGIPLDLLEVYRVGGSAMAPTSALPIGASRSVSETQLQKLDLSESAMDQSTLLHSVIALLQPPRGGGGPGKRDSEIDPPPTDDEILGSRVLGFLHVADIDAQRKKMTVLSPMPGKLPSKTALIGVSQIHNSSPHCES